MGAELGKVIPLAQRQRTSPSWAFLMDGSAAIKPATSFAPFQELHAVPTFADRPANFGDKLSLARSQFAEKLGERKLVKAYEVEQDVVLYKVLAKEKGTGNYEKAKRDLDAYIDVQLQTHLGERLNVGISRLRHTINDGEMRIANTGESLLEMLKRGQQYRRKHGKEVDWNRELAEVVGFGRIQERLTDPNTPVGTKIFFVSPPGDVKNGSIYKSNFTDVHEKVSETEVVSTRYTSGLTPAESQRRLRVIDSRYDRTGVPTDAEFIANPVEVAPATKGLETSDAIHDFMHVNHSHMNRQKFAVIMQACKPLRDEYKQSLLKDPDNLVEHKRRMDILMNYADNVAKELEFVPEEHVVALGESALKDARPWLAPQIDREALAQQQVRVTETGCGSSGSTSSSQFSVAESAPGKEGGNCTTCNKSSQDNHYHCPSCTKRYADETNRDAQSRTKQCGCGFEFNC